MTEPVDFDGGAPRSPRFGDIYFNPDDGLAESRAVFLAGCGLPDAWAGRRRFTVGELGFGTGLNVLALLELWARAKPADGRLHIFSVEAFPIAREDAARALAAFPELAPFAAPLLAAWPQGRTGGHTIELAPDVTLHLQVGEAAEALAGWTGRADAWFLDGFAPARNPRMWTPELMAQIAAHSAPGARVATFTVAGAVRAGLQAAGFQVARLPGFGRKKQRLQARFPGRPEADRVPGRAAVVGGGVAGASLVRALQRQGWATILVDSGRGDAASANPAALVTPRLDAGLGPAARLHAEAFARACALIRQTAPHAVLAEGLVQFARTPQDVARFDRLAAWTGFDPGALERLGPETASAALGEAAGEALRLCGGLVIEPAALLQAWLVGVERVEAQVARMVRESETWRLLDAAGRPIGEAETVVIASGAGAAALLPGFDLRPTRGQVSVADQVLPGAPSAFGGYAIPTRQGLLFGATHDRGDAGQDVREADHARNLARLAEGRPALARSLAASLADAPLRGRAAVRLATPDHLPLADEVDPGRFALTGLGGRGFTLAPLLAEHVAALLAGTPSPLSRDLAGLVRAARRTVRLELRGA